MKISRWVEKMCTKVGNNSQQITPETKQVVRVSTNHNCCH